MSDYNGAPDTDTTARVLIDTSLQDTAGDLADMFIETEEQESQSRAKRDLWQTWGPTKTPEPVQCFRGSYGASGSPIAMRWQAWVPSGDGGKFVPCTCEGGHSTDPCVLHWMVGVERQRRAERVQEFLQRNMLKEADELQKKKIVYIPRPYYAINVLRLSFFHETYETKEYGGRAKQYKKYVRCPDARFEIPAGQAVCPMCQQGLKRTFGQRRYLSLGTGKYRGLMSVDRQLSRYCLTCGGRGPNGEGTIITAKYVCRRCGAMLLDPYATDKPPQVVEDYWRTKVVCGNCGFQGRPVEDKRCHMCPNPKSASIWDVPFNIYTSGEGKQATIAMSGLPGTPQQYSDEVLKKMRPYDFDSMFNYTTEEQTKALRLQANPFADGAAAPAAAVAPQFQPPEAAAVREAIPWNQVQSTVTPGQLAPPATPPAQSPEVPPQPPAPPVASSEVPPQQSPVVPPQGGSQGGSDT